MTGRNGQLFPQGLVVFFIATEQFQCFDDSWIIKEENEIARRLNISKNGLDFVI